MSVSPYLQVHYPQNRVYTTEVLDHLVLVTPTLIDGSRWEVLAAGRKAAGFELPAAQLKVLNKMWLHGDAPAVLCDDKGFRIDYPTSRLKPEAVLAMAADLPRAKALYRRRRGQPLLAWLHKPQQAVLGGPERPLLTFISAEAVAATLKAA